MDMNLDSDDFKIIKPSGEGGGTGGGEGPDNVETWKDPNEPDEPNGDGDNQDPEGKQDGKGKPGNPDYSVSADFGDPVDGGVPGGILTPEQSAKLQEELGIPQKLPTMTKEQIRDKIKKSINDPENFGEKNDAKSKSRTPGSMIGDFRAALAEIARGKVDWKRLLKKFIGSKPRGERQFLGNRRHLHSGDYMWGTKENPDGDIGHLVAAADVSGSMSDLEIAIVLAEIKSLVKARSIENTTIVYFHHEIEKIVELKSKDAVKRYKFTNVKQGGTNFIPPLQVMDSYYKKGQLELGVFMTDGFADTDLPKPKYVSDFIWVILNNPTYTPPWGNKVVYINSNDIDTSQANF